jgi:anti-sigma regulatory factor (Ser/Thr protein kinase)
METAGVDPDISYDLSLALSEACANAVEHGGEIGLQDSTAAYRVTAYLDGEKCRIEVTDSGPWRRRTAAVSVSSRNSPITSRSATSRAAAPW